MEKYDNEGTELVPGHSRIKPKSEKSPVEKQLDGVSAQLRTLTSKVDAAQRAHDADVRSVIVEKQAEIEPLLAAGRKALTEMRKVTEEFAPVVAAVLALNHAGIHRALPLKSRPKVDVLFREADALRHLMGAVPASIRESLKRADALALGDCGGSWGAIRDGIVYPIEVSVGVPADIIKRAGLLQAMLGEVEQALAKAAEGEAHVLAETRIERPSTLDHVPQQRASKDFDPLNTDPTTREGN